VRASNSLNIKRSQNSLFCKHELLVTRETVRMEIASRISTDGASFTYAFQFRWSSVPSRIH